MACLLSSTHRRRQGRNTNDRNTKGRNTKGRNTNGRRQHPLVRKAASAPPASTPPSQSPVSRHRNLVFDQYLTVLLHTSARAPTHPRTHTRTHVHTVTRRGASCRHVARRDTRRLASGRQEAPVSPRRGTGWPLSWWVGEWFTADDWRRTSTMARRRRRAVVDGGGTHTDRPCACIKGVAERERERGPGSGPRAGPCRDPLTRSLSLTIISDHGGSRRRGPGHGSESESATTRSDSAGPSRRAPEWAHSGNYGARRPGGPAAGPMCHYL
jgi:hypothetical protein